MNLTKLLLSLLLSLTLFSVFADENLEIPVLKLLKMNFNELDPSSDPEVMMRQFEYTSSASPEELLQFYRSSEHTQSCNYNDMADNHICKLTKQGKVSSGYVFIPSESKNGVTVILADYFLNQSP